MKTLVEALDNVELQPGRTYRCHIRNMRIELRVTPGDDGDAPSLHEEAPMAPWFEFPAPAPISVIKAIPTPLPMPARYDIPPEGDAPA